MAVEAYAAQLNTQDASLGNAIVQQTIVELPSFARNVANLLQFQPGVTNFGTNNNHGRATTTPPRSTIATVP